MSFDLASITNAKRMRAPRIILLGGPGIGKSELIAGVDDVVFAPVTREEGIDDLDVPTFPVLAKFDDGMKVLQTLYEEEHEHKAFALDSSSTFASLVTAQALRKENVSKKGDLGGGYGHQFDTILELWQQFMDGCDLLRNDRNMTIIIIGHVTVRGSRVPGVESFDQWAYDIDKKAADALVRWSDCAMFMGRKTVVKKQDGAFGKEEKQGVDIAGGQRFLFTQETPTHPGKTRGYFGNLPAEIPLPRYNAWNTFMDAVTVAAKAGTPE